MKRRRRTCVVVEGPWDAIKIDYYGRRHGISAVSMFGTGVSEGQLDLLINVKNNCERLVVCGDSGAEGNVLDLLSATVDMNLSSVSLPQGVSDPGELDKEQVVKLFRSERL